MKMNGCQACVQADLDVREIHIGIDSFETFNHIDPDRGIEVCWHPCIPENAAKEAPLQVISPMSMTRDILAHCFRTPTVRCELWLKRRQIIPALL